MTGYFSASGGPYHTHERCPFGFAIPVELMRRGEVGDREVCHLCLTVVELLLTRGGLIGLSTLPWLTDLVPAAIISLHAAKKTPDVAI
jgi:hypothetical protein